MTARTQAMATLAQGGFGQRERIVRINPLDSPWGHDDLRAMHDAQPDAVLVPKINGPDDVYMIDALIPSGSNMALWVMVETARAVMHLREIAATASDSALACLVLGTNDLSSEIGASPGSDRAPLMYAIGACVMAARAHGLAVLDGVFNQIDDTAGLESQCRQAFDFGFDGKTLIHPGQIAICNAAFTPGEAAIEAARRVVAAFALEENRGKGVIRVDGRMIERLHCAQAQRILSMAERSDAF
jgi:citrate lyase subunit beta/citryl-CoA lyase